jgi:hypothetical protein
MNMHNTGNWARDLPKGEVTLPSGKTLHNTGQVVIGSAYQPKPDYSRPVPESTLWLQELLLAPKAKA